MKLTKTKLKEIIKEEIAKAEGNYEPPEEEVAAAQILQRIKKVLDEAERNKSFGFNPGVATRYLEEVTNILNSGGEETETEKRGRESAHVMKKKARRRQPVDSREEKAYLAKLQRQRGSEPWHKRITRAALGQSGIADAITIAGENK